MGILKRFIMITCTAMLALALPMTVYAVPDEETPVQEITDAYQTPEPEPEPEPETEYIPETEPVAEPETEPIEIYTDPDPVEEEVTEDIQEYTEPDPEPVATEPLTESYETEEEQQWTLPENIAGYIEDYTLPTDNEYLNKILKLPTLMDSTEPAEELPQDFGADSENGGVSYAGGIVCWVCVGVALIAVLGFVISSTGRRLGG